MKITVIGVGKIKEKYFTDAIKEYAKRLSRYCKLEIVEVADEKTPDGASETLNAQIKEKEGVRILQKIPESAYVVALAIDGEDAGFGRTGSPDGALECRRYQPDRICDRWVSGTGTCSSSES